MPYSTRKACRRACLEIAVGASSLVKVALFSGPRCLSLLRYFEHAKVVFRWKMLVTLTLFRDGHTRSKWVNFNKNTLRVVNYGDFNY